MDRTIHQASMKNLLILVYLFISSMTCFGQGRNSTWLIGNDPGWPLLGRFTFDSTGYVYQTEPRKMSFKGTEATFSDEHGNFLMSSNGVWISNANNDTMMNGSGLNPGVNVSSHPNGLLNNYANLFLQYPGDSTRILLIHHTDEWDGYS